MAFRRTVWRDAYRSLRGAPLVTTLAVVSLTLGIGANTALFSLVNSLILKSLPVREPGQLAVLQDGSWTNFIWEEIRAREHDLFDGAFAWSAERFDLSTTGETDPIDGAYASGRMFDVLGVVPERGRLLSAADDVRGGGSEGAVAVISDRLWRRRFGAAEDAIGRTLSVQRVQFTIVGVMPASFTGPDVGRAADVIVPIGTEALVRGKETFLDGRSTWWLEIMVRLKPGETLDEATAGLRAVQPQIRQTAQPIQAPPGLSLARMQEGFLREPLTLVAAANGRSPLRTRYERPLVAILVVVGLVLLIACANIANLLLARAAARRREISVRLALGASRGQVVSQLLAESLMLAGTGAAIGFFVARWSSAFLVSQLVTWRESVVLNLSADWRVFAFTAGLALVTVLVFGLAPALTATRVAPGDVLRAAGRGVAGDRRFGVRGSLVILQVALSFVLVVAAALFLRTFGSLSRVPLGFTPERLALAEVSLQRIEASADARAVVVEQLRAAAAATPGVQQAAASLIVPLTGQGWNSGVDGSTARDHMTWMNGITPGWFATTGMRLLAGRDLTAADLASKAPVVIVNEMFAARYLPGASPIGRSVRISATTYEVVGLVNDAVYRNVREGTVPTAYVTLFQQPGSIPRMTLALDVPPAQRAATLRAVAEAFAATDARAGFTFRTYDDLTSAMVAQERLVAILGGVFGAIALLLAAVGLYGVMAYSVNQRRTEIGVRLALGCSGAGILRLVFGRLGVLQIVGLTIGLAVSMWAAKFVASMLFHVEARDPVVLATAAAMLLATGALAAFLPARRATKLDPASILRSE